LLLVIGHAVLKIIWDALHQDRIHGDRSATPNLRAFRVIREELPAVA
jgi:hypothetical protein